MTSGIFERDCQPAFIERLKEIYPEAYVFVDKDSPYRVHKSGWDFYIAHDDFGVMHFECKIADGKLRDSQERAKHQIEKAKLPYYIARFINIKDKNNFRVQVESLQGITYIDVGNPK